MLYARQLIQKKMADTLDMWYFVLICACALLGSACQKPGICLLSVGRDAKQLCRKTRGIIGSRETLGASIPSPHATSGEPGGEWEWGWLPNIRRKVSVFPGKRNNRWDASTLK